MQYVIFLLQESLTRLRGVCEAYSWKSPKQAHLKQHLKFNSWYDDLLHRRNISVEDTLTCCLQASLTHLRGVCEADSWNEFHELLRNRTAYIWCSKPHRIYSGIFRHSAKILAKASMRNTNFKKYAGLFRRPPNVANRIRLRRATSNAHVFNKISYAGLSKWSQRGGLENLSVYRTNKSRNPLKTLTVSLVQKLQKLAHLT